MFPSFLIIFAASKNIWISGDYISKRLSNHYKLKNEGLWKKDEGEDLRVKKLIGEITKLLPERSKIKTDLLYFKYAPILVMLMRWYGVSQFYDNKMEIKLWYEENEEPVWFFYFITYILYPISLWKGQVLHRLCVEWRIPILYIAGVNVIHIMYDSVVITKQMYYCDMFLITLILILYAYVAISKLQHHRSWTSCSRW